MLAGKWSYEKRDYEPYRLPEGSVLYSEDLTRVVPCAACGKELVYGQSHTSMEIHNDLGFGYSVCNECHEKEWERRRKEV